MNKHEDLDLAILSVLLKGKLVKTIFYLLIYLELDIYNSNVLVFDSKP